MARSSPLLPGKAIYVLYRYLHMIPLQMYFTQHSPALHSLPPLPADTHLPQTFSSPFLLSFPPPPPLHANAKCKVRHSSPRREELVAEKKQRDPWMAAFDSRRAAWHTYVCTNTTKTYVLFGYYGRVAG